MNAYSRSASPDTGERVASSDVFEIADACIERVREAAGLDDVDVLPPLPVVAPRREVVVLLKSDVADGRAHRAPALVTTHRVKRPTPPGSRWALALCAMFAVSSAGASFLSSPIGHRPSVLRVTGATRAHARNAVHVVVETARSIAR